MKKKNLKRISLILTLITLISFISFKQRASADDLSGTNVELPSEPTFEVEMSATPDPALIGEDITVSGTITPNDFETTIPSKEIVLVLDTSGSMSGNKISELKKAAKSFVDKMKEVDNLKIGIVTYASEASIKTKDGNTFTFWNPKTSAEKSKLDSEINNISANGGTNIGEGLRKAIYLLDKVSTDTTAIKTIVLMTDGEPTFYSINKANNYNIKDWNTYSDRLKEQIKSLFETGKYSTSGYQLFWSWSLTSKEKAILKELETSRNHYYSEIDNSNPAYEGPGNSQIFYTLDYAKYMGSLIKDKGYNAYSVGYGLKNNSDGEKALKEIHSAMSGNNMNDETKTNEEKGFFTAGETAITTVFNTIATNILDSYPVNNVALNITFSRGFTLNIGENEVPIGNIVYTKTGDVSNNKVKYTAEAIPFSFIVKASGEVLGQQDINTDIKISYKFENNEITKPIGQKLSINIKSNQLPIIEAKLTSDKEKSLTKGEVLNVKYTLSPEDFEFKDVNNSVAKDVVILIDNSNLVDSETFELLTNNLYSKLLNHTTLVNARTNYSLISFSNEAIKLSDFTTNITSLNNDVIKNINQTSNVANLDTAIDKATEVFNSRNNNNTKNIIIMAQDNIDYTDNKIKKLENKGYNIIILSLSNEINSKLKSLENNNNLAISKDSIISIENSTEDVVKNSINKVAERLINTTKYKPYIINPEISINLANAFELVEGGTSTNNSVKILSDKKVVYNYNETTKKYHAEPIDIEFKVKAISETTGTYNLGTTLLKYEKIVGGYKESYLTEPVITIKEAVKDLVHGLYSGIVNNQIVIEKSTEERGFEIIGGSTVTFATKFKTSNDKIKALIDIDDKFDYSKTNIMVYKLTKTDRESILTKIEDVQSAFTGNKVEINIENLGKEENEILIIYKEKVKETSIDEIFENKVNIGTLTEKVNISTPANSNKNENSTPSERLPNLF